MMVRFLCASDPQIGSGPDLGRTPTERLAEQEAGWARAIELAHEAEADAILFGGDAFEGPIPTPEHYEAFARPARGSKIPILAISGNGRHDAATRTPNALERVRDTPLLTVHRYPGIARIAGVAIVTLPWTSDAHAAANTDGGDRDAINQAIADGLISIARGLRAKVEEDTPGMPALMLGHFHVDTAISASGTPTHVFREPLLPLSELEDLGFAAVLLGHNHRPQMLSRGSVPVFHIGSLMPQNFGEAGFDHGVWILDIEDNGEAACSFVPIESRPFVTYDLYVDAALSGSLDQTREFVDGTFEDAIVKVRVAATAEQARRLDIGKLKREILAAGAHKVWAVQTEIQREQRVRVEGLDETIDELDAFDRYLAANGINGTRGARLRDLCETYLQETRS